MNGSACCRDFLPPIKRVRQACKKRSHTYAFRQINKDKAGWAFEAQQQAVRLFSHAYRYQIVGEIIEVESGKNNNRPLLLDALQQCKDKQATLLIARLDRLARNVAFIAQLMESGVDFKAIDNPFAGKLVLHIMAAFAEHERDQISERTRAALQAAKLRGVRLGSHGRDVLSKQHREESLRFATSLLPTVSAIRDSGVNTVRGIMTELNRLQVPTYHGGDTNWHISTVHKLLKQITPSPITHEPPTL